MPHVIDCKLRVSSGQPFVVIYILHWKSVSPLKCLIPSGLIHYIQQ